MGRRRCATNCRICHVFFLLQAAAKVNAHNKINWQMGIGQNTRPSPKRAPFSIPPPIHPSIHPKTLRKPGEAWGSLRNHNFFQTFCPTAIRAHSGNSCLAIETDHKFHQISSIFFLDPKCLPMSSNVISYCGLEFISESCEGHKRQGRTHIFLPCPNMSSNIFIYCIWPLFYSFVAQAFPRSLP